MFEMATDANAIVKNEKDTVSNGKDIKEGDFLISCSKKLEVKDYIQIGMSKSWLLTAKTLYPHQVSIHFEAYKIEKIRLDVKEAAKCFSALVNNFVNDSCVWQEVVTITNTLRVAELTQEQSFLKEMFFNLPSDTQHRLLWLRANQSDDTMDHCRFMLLLLTNFPSTTVPKHGLEVMENLIAAEKNTLQQSPVNCYRKLLVCNLVPLLVSIELPLKQILRLLVKSFQFYICYMTTKVAEIKDLPEDEKKIDNPWKNLFYIYEKFASKLGWELNNLFSNSWTRESAWQRITTFIHCHPELITNETVHRQAVYGMNLLFLHSLHEYVEKIYEGNMILVEMPLEVYSNKTSSVEPPTKRLKVKVEEDIILTAHNRQVPINTFIFAFKCWDLFHSSETFEREFVKVTQNLKIENWCNHFLQAVYLYKGLYKECLINISYNEEVLKKHIHLITIYFWLKQYLPMLEGIIEVIQLLKLNLSNDSLSPAMNGSTSGNYPPSSSFDEEMPGYPIQKIGMRHLHFLYLSKENIVKYLTKLLIVALKKSAENGGNDSVNDGHILVLLQLNWPAERHIFDEIIARIKRNRTFRYHLFMTYIVNMQMLEEFMFLSSDTSVGAITLDIMIPTTNQLISQRRMSTRGVDKGAKEDFKLTMRKQTARESETCICSLVMNFITAEKDHLLSAFGVLSS